MTTVALGEVADLNPRPLTRPSGDQPVSFVPMAMLDSTNATAGPGESRPFREVQKGYTIFRDQDLLVAKITPCFENNKIGQARLTHDVGVGSTEFHVIRPHEEVLDGRYALHFLRQQRVLLDGERRMTGSSGQRRVPVQFLADLELPLPCIEEQRRIAATLDQADALRAKRRQALALLNGLTQSIFLDMFGDTAYEPRPLAGWIAADRPITYGILKPGPNVLDGVPYVRVADMKHGGIYQAGLRRTSREINNAYRRSTLRTGDLLMSIRGHVGRLAEIPDNLAGANITQDSARLAVPPESTSYVRAALESERLQNWMARRTKGVAVRGINLGDLRLAPIPDAPLPLQREFATRARAVESLMQHERCQLMKAHELFLALQARAFSGRL